MSAPLHTASTPLVGRAREQALLREALAAALAGRGVLVLIGGEAGIGKTALAEALCQEAAAQGALVLAGRCYDLSETPPYGPWIDLFAHLPTAAPPPPPAFARRGTVGPITSQAELCEQVCDFLTARATQRPVVLLLDDLHWADPASLDLLRALARQLGPSPLLVLATYRSDELTHRHPLYTLLPLLVREGGAQRLDLARFTETAVQALIAARYALPPSEAARLGAYLLSRGEGNALFTLELLRTLEEQGTLAATGGGWVLGALDRVPVPVLLAQVIAGRVARLGEEAARLLPVAAVIGQEVPLAVWQLVAEAGEATLLAVAERAEEVGLLTEAAGGDGVRFAHALVREALYAGLPSVRRRRLHRRTGEVLAARHGPDPDAVAYHFQRAGDARAADWLVRAGERAQRAYALLMAAEYYEAAIALAEHTTAPAAQRGWLLYQLALLRRGYQPSRAAACAEEASRIALLAGDAALAAGAQFLLGFIHANTESNEESLAALAAGVAALEALTPADHARLNEQDGLPPAAESKTWRGVVVFHLALVGRYAEALAMGERFLASRNAPSTGDALRAWYYGGAHLGMGIASAMLGHPSPASRSFSDAHTYYKAVGAYSNMSHTSLIHLQLVLLHYDADRVNTRLELANAGEQMPQHPNLTGSIHRWVRIPVLLIEGGWTTARDLAEEARCHDHRAMRRLGNTLLGPLLRAQGELDAAWKCVNELLPGGPKTSPGAGRCDEAITLQRLAVGLALDASNLPIARGWLEAHDRWLDWSGAVLGRSEGQALWVEYHRQAGDLLTAHAHAEAALASASEPRQPLALLAARRLLGELATAEGNHAEAAAHLDAALSLGDACAAPYERALTLLALADLAAATGERGHADAALTEARALLEPLQARPALARAAAIAARLATANARAHHPSATSAYPAGLSAREVAVLRLVAAGLTNAQAAERLFVSSRTVDQHLRSIYTKLGVSSRAAASAWAAQHGLAGEEP